MKKTLLIAALALATSPAMASKARLTALNNGAHLSDIQDVFRNASKATEHGDWLTFEMGPKPTSNGTFTNPRAEGGFSRSMGDAKYGFYMGHASSWVTDGRTGLAAGALAPENSLNLFYAMKAGEMAWGVGLEYSKSDKKSTSEKQSTMGLNGGIQMGALALGLTIGLENKYTSGSPSATYTDLKGNTAFDLSGTYSMDTMTYSFGYYMNGAKADTGATPTQTIDRTITQFNVGAEQSMKKDGGDVFYGAKLTSSVNDNKATGGTKVTEMKLPVYLGVEADATSWMVLRASVQQNFLIGSTKSETAPASAETDTIPNDTVVAAGVGLKFGKLMLDGTFKSASGTASTGAIDGSNFLANAALTYNF